MRNLVKDTHFNLKIMNGIMKADEQGPRPLKEMMRKAMMRDPIRRPNILPGSLIKYLTRVLLPTEATLTLV